MSRLQSKTSDEIVILAIEGVDVMAGLGRVVGNRKLYRSLLTQFSEKQADAATQISAALQSSDPALAERIAHTVKGVAGNIGITKVQFAAEAVEKAIRNQDPAVSGLLAEFDSLLRAQIQLIAEALAKTESAPSPSDVHTKFDPEAATAALNNLRRLLEASDGDAQDAFLVLQGVIGGQIPPHLISALGGAIHDFNFESALTNLDEFANGLGWTRDRGRNE